MALDLRVKILIRVFRRSDQDKGLGRVRLPARPVDVTYPTLSSRRVAIGTLTRSPRMSGSASGDNTLSVAEIARLAVFKRIKRGAQSSPLARRFESHPAGKITSCRKSFYL